MRAKDRIRSKRRCLSKNLDDAARTEPASSPMFHSMIASGMKTSDRNSKGASLSETTEVIFAWKTGETDERQRHKKFASAGHFNVFEILLHFGTVNSCFLGIAGRLRVFRKCSACSDARPIKAADKKYPSVNTDVCCCSALAMSK